VSLNDFFSSENKILTGIPPYPLVSGSSELELLSKSAETTTTAEFPFSNVPLPMPSISHFPAFETHAEVVTQPRAFLGGVVTVGVVAASTLYYLVWLGTAP
jgi:hypothetical protein